MLKINSKRSKDLIKQIGLSFIFKGGSVLIGIFYVPLSIKVLGTTDYGIWLTMFSVVNFFNFFDFGLGHGLRNYLTPEIAKKNYLEAKIYISNAYLILSFTSLSLIAIFFVSFDYVSWQKIFKIKNENIAVFNVLLKALFLIFFSNLTLKLIDVIFYAYLKPSIPGILNFLNNLLAFIIINFLFFYDRHSFLNYGLTILLVQFGILLFANLLIFIFLFKKIRPNFLLFDIKYAKKIFSLGGSFFIVQISAIILYSTDNFIINSILSPSDVTTYNVVYKYFGLFTMISSLILSPLWSAITDANARNDHFWIRSAIKKSIYLVSFLSLIVFLFLIISDYIYGKWVGNNIYIPFNLSMTMAMYVISSMFLQIFVMYLNGLGILKVQLFVGVFCALINIPLSIFFAKNLDMGLVGVISATLLCNLITLLFLPYQYFLNIKGNAKGIWIK